MGIVSDNEGLLEQISIIESEVDNIRTLITQASKHDLSVVAPKESGGKVFISLDPKDTRELIIDGLKVYLERVEEKRDGKIAELRRRLGEAIGNTQARL
jgi:hypothetical protein